VQEAAGKMPKLEENLFLGAVSGGNLHSPSLLKELRFFGSGFLQITSLTLCFSGYHFYSHSSCNDESADPIDRDESSGSPALHHD
jgi:hypothetical protein